MSRYPVGKVILLADDDPDDWILLRNAMQETGIPMDLRMVVDGEELMDYLMLRGAYADPSLAPEPHLILLDLNMPRKDGREALAEIKADQKLRRIPIVVFTTSKEDQDILRCYQLGASSYVTKPCSFSGMLEMAVTLGKYWLQIVELPSGEAPDAVSMEDKETKYGKQGSWNL
jgi:CheY-like chemotaxis protein